MRTVEFGAHDRFVLIPVGLGKSLKQFFVFVFAAILYAGFAPGGVIIQKAWTGSWPLFALGLGAVCAGSVLVPLLLPLFRLDPFP